MLNAMLSGFSEVSVVRIAEERAQKKPPGRGGFRVWLEKVLGSFLQLAEIFGGIGFDLFLAATAAGADFDGHALVGVGG